MGSPRNPWGLQLTSLGPQVPPDGLRQGWGLLPPWGGECRCALPFTAGALPSRAVLPMLRPA